MGDKQSRRRFSVDLRRDVVKLVTEGGKTCAGVAAAHQVPVSSVYAWVRKHRIEKEAGPQVGETSLAAMQIENARLRRELKLARDQALFLRKTAAFFASEKR